MKVLLVVHRYPPDGLGGAETHTADLARELARRGHEVTVFAGRQDGDARYGHGRRSDGAVDVRLIDTRAEPGWQMDVVDELVRSEFERLVDEIGPDVVHVEHVLLLSGDLIEAAKKKALRVVVTLHDFWFQCPLLHPGPGHRHPLRWPLWGVACFGHRELAPPRRWTYVLRMALRGELGAALGPHLRRARFFRRQLRRADVVLTPSRFLRAAFVRFGVPRRRIEVLQYPLRTTRIEAPPIADPVTFGFVGTIAAAKGVDVLCRAFARASCRSTLLLFGRVADEAYFEDLRPFLGDRVRYEGDFDHARVEEVFRRFDVLVVPSVVHETLSIVTLEAQAAGRPVIASAGGGLLELIEDGRNGLLVPPGDEEALARAIERLADATEARRLAAASIEPASLERYADRIEELYAGRIRAPGARATSTRRAAGSRT